MSPAITWMLLGSLATWLTLLMPPYTLIALLLNQSIVPGLLLSVIIAPVVFGLMMHTLRGDSVRLRWVWVQAVGAGSILMPIAMAGLMFRQFLPAPQVATLLVIAWIILMLTAIRAAHHIHERLLGISTPELARRQKLVHISDVHIGSRSPAFLEKVVTQVMRHNPDLVVITGDLLDSSQVGAKELQALSRITCPAYFCVGNHERYVDLDAAIAAISYHGVIVLRDEVHMHDDLRLIGIDDRDRPDRLPEIIRQLDRVTPAFEIALYHRPDGWPALAQAGVQLTLSGHTHAGQIWPFGLLVKKQYPDMAGLFEEAGKRLYVSQGTGTWGPTFRLGTRCEMTIIDLQTTN